MYLLPCRQKVGFQHGLPPQLFGNSPGDQGSFRQVSGDISSTKSLTRDDTDRCARRWRWQPLSHLEGCGCGEIHGGLPLANRSGGFSGAGWIFGSGFSGTCVDFWRLRTFQKSMFRGRFGQCYLRNFQSSPRPCSAPAIGLGRGVPRLTSGRTFPQWVLFFCPRGGIVLRCEFANGAEFDCGRTSLNTGQC